MPRGIIIPADDSLDVEERDFSGLQDYQSAVGGYIETVSLVEPAFATALLVLNEEGKIQNLPVNRRATLLGWMHQPALRFRDEVCGNAVLIGKANIRGDFTDAPNRLIRQLLSKTRFAVEIISNNADSTKRVHRTAVFKNWEYAAIVAIDIVAIMPADTEIRVVPE